MHDVALTAFADAVCEPKVTREDMVRRTWQRPVVKASEDSSHNFVEERQFLNNGLESLHEQAGSKGTVMRKNMTQCIKETLDQVPEVRPRSYIVFALDIKACKHSFLS